MVDRILAFGMSGGIMPDRQFGTPGILVARFAAQTLTALQKFAEKFDTCECP